MSQQTNGIYEFGSFRLDAQERLLQRDGATISLTPSAFDLLLALK
jgi:DNA-binding response OmpR family regulator